MQPQLDQSPAYGTKDHGQIKQPTSNQETRALAAAVLVQPAEPILAIEANVEVAEQKKEADADVKVSGWKS